MAAAQPVDYAAGQPPKLDMSLRVRLSVMMFLQYAIWGIWAPILGLHLAGLADFQIEGGAANQGRIGLIYMTMPIASIIAPFIGGQIADRYFAAQRFLGISQLLGGVVLIAVARMTSFYGIFAGMLVYNLLYAPTIALSNSIAFQHWPNDQFSRIRVWGSIGWIAIGWVFGIAWMEWVGPRFTDTAIVQCLYFGAALSLLYGLIAFALPHTPPSNKGGNPLAFLDAVGMLRDPAFAIMALVSFFAALEMQLYFIWGQSFLNKGLGIDQSRVGPALTAGQICEMVMMVILPFVLRSIGFKLTMALGIAAWALRDVAFIIGEPTPMVLGAVSLHGVGFAFFFTVIFMFTDRAAPADIKSSAQAFLASVTIGCGMLAGSLLAGPISVMADNQWKSMFAAPAILLGICCVVFLVAFRPRPEVDKPKA